MLGLTIPQVLFNVLTVAFFVVVALGVALGVYAASSLKKREQNIGDE